MSSRKSSLASSALVLAAALALCLVPSATRADPLEQGDISLSGGFSGARFGGNTYYALGLSGGYFVLDGFEIGASVSYLFGGTPSIVKLSPQLRYIATMVPYVHPYITTFYRRWFLSDGFEDIDSVGAGLGIVLISGEHFALGIGVTYEHIVSECTGDCWQIYPAVGGSFVF